MKAKEYYDVSSTQHWSKGGLVNDQEKKKFFNQKIDLVVNQASRKDIPPQFSIDLGGVWHVLEVEMQV